MPLNFDLTKCTVPCETPRELDSSILVYSDLDWSVAKILIWKTMAVKMRGITAETWKEFYLRCHICECLDGANRIFIDDGSPSYITPAEVHRWIGLSCNVRDESRAAFKNKERKYGGKSFLHIWTLAIKKAHKAIREFERTLPND